MLAEAKNLIIVVYVWHSATQTPHLCSANAAKMLFSPEVLHQTCPCGSVRGTLSREKDAGWFSCGTARAGYPNLWHHGRPVSPRSAVRSGTGGTSTPHKNSRAEPGVSPEPARLLILGGVTPEVSRARCNFLGKTSIEPREVCQRPYLMLNFQAQNQVSGCSSGGQPIHSVVIRGSMVCAKVGYSTIPADLQG